MNWPVLFQPNTSYNAAAAAAPDVAYEWVREWIDRQQHNPMYFTNGQWTTMAQQNFDRMCQMYTLHTHSHPAQHPMHGRRVRSPIGFCKSPLSDPFVCELNESARARAVRTDPDEQLFSFSIFIIIDWPMRGRFTHRVHFNQPPHSYSCTRWQLANRKSLLISIRFSLSLSHSLLKLCCSFNCAGAPWPLVRQFGWCLNDFCVFA